MKILDKASYKEVCTWIHYNARPLDLAFWSFCFENGSREAVVDALSYYQNEDGGFGNGIEPDSWNTESSPYSTLWAIGLLRRIGFPETAGMSHPIFSGILRYLESGVHSNEDGWFFTIPSNDEFPHAPWWSYGEEMNRLQSMGVTAGLCAFVLRYADQESALYKRAFDYAGKLLKKAATSEEFGEMGAGSVGMLLADIQERGLSSAFPCSGLQERIMETVNRTIERDPQKWSLYTKTPSDFISSPDSPFYKGNEEIVEKELDYLIDTRNPGGVWNITWTWFDLGEKYQKEFAISENWWMAARAIEKIAFLKSFGRIG